MKRPFSAIDSDYDSKVNVDNDNPKKQKLCSPSIANLNIKCGFAKYRAVKLHDIMPKDKIVYTQKYAENILDLKKQKVKEHRVMLQQALVHKTEIGLDLFHTIRTSNFLVTNDYLSPNGDCIQLPRYHLQSVDKDWDCSLPRIHDIIQRFLHRNWKQWQFDVSSDKFTIAEINDPQNPAKKYGENEGVHEEKIYGLFATEFIAKDTLLFEYSGVVKRYGDTSPNLGHLGQELEQTTLFDLHGTLFCDRSCEENVRYWGDTIDQRLVIDPSVYHNEGVYMNDYRSNVMVESDDDEEEEEEEESEMSEAGNKKDVRVQNVKFFEVLVNNWPRVFAVCIRDIEPGNELLTDYGSEFWKNFRELKHRANDLQQIIAQVRQSVHQKWQSKYSELEQRYVALEQKYNELLDKMCKD